MLKMRLDCIPSASLREMRDVSRFVSELANRRPWGSQPYVGDSAFAHKGGIHVSAVLKHAETYEHIDPEAVGNHRRVLVSELAGQSNILWKAKEYGIDLDKNTPEARRILEMLKRMEDEGFQFEGAEASFELLMERALGNHKPYFDLDGFRVIVEEERDGGEPVAEATVRLRSRAWPSTRPPPATGRSTRSTRAPQGPRGVLPEPPRDEPAGLQGAHPRRVQGHRGQDARAHHLRRWRRDVGYRRGGRQHHRSLLAGPRRFHRVQAPPRRAPPFELSALLSGEASAE